MKASRRFGSYWESTTAESRQSPDPRAAALAGWVRFTKAAGELNLTHGAISRAVRNIEDRLGRGRYLLFYLVGGVAATLLHALFTPSSPVPLIGASGAVSAVLGAYIVLFPRQRVLTYIVPVFVFWLPAWVYLGYWALVQGVQALNGLTLLGGGDNIAWWAHVGGFLYGALVVRGLERNPSPVLRQ